MTKKTRLIILLSALALLGIVGLVWAWMPAAQPKEEQAIIDAAADSARQSQAAQPPPADDPKRSGRARPGAMGGR